MTDEDFCFRRLIVTGRVSQLRKDTSFGVCGLYFWLTVERMPRPTKVLRCCGEIWGPQLAIAEQVQEGSIMKVSGCFKGPDLTAAVQLSRFDLEELLKVY